MSKAAHRIFIGTLVAIVFIAIIWLINNGLSYYRTAMEERVYHEEHLILKPSGTLGHAFGIAGSLFMIIGMASYMARKRYRFLSRMGLLKHWLEFHIFLCTLGPILVLFHTSYKFGGLVAISFWSMVAVFTSGIIGRFIYIQIPRTVDGRELSNNEVKGMMSDEDEISLNRRIERLDTMRNLFRYWHVAHLPFALVMLIIMVIHVGVTILFGYRWIF
jgi:hypothetical protein